MFNADGSRQTSGFGSGGIATATFWGANESARAIAVQEDGKILLAGLAEDDVDYAMHVALARFNADGTPDTTFGEVVSGSTRSGRTTYSDPYGWVGGMALAIDDQGRIIVAGQNATEFVALRFTPQGEPDSGFGASGVAAHSFGGYSSQFVQSLAIQADGKLLLGGYGQSGGSSYQFLLARLTQTGTLDTTFGDMVSNDETRCVPVSVPEMNLRMVLPMKGVRSRRKFTSGRHSASES